MSKNNQRSAQMNAKLYGFNQETFQTFRQSKPLILLNFISKNWVLFKKNTLECALSFRECHSYFYFDVYHWFYCVIQLLRMGNLPCMERGNQLWYNDNVLSLSGTLTSSVNSLAGLIPSAVSLTISAGRRNGYCRDAAGRL